MAYGIIYQISYYRKSGIQTTIDILEKDYAGASSDLLAAGNPLEISFDGDVNNIYKPTIGSGASIRVVATPLSLQGLFTTDPQKYKVKIYDGGSEDSSGGLDNLIWQGFINTGIYTESYSTPICLKSPITLVCNDGLSILGDLLYLNGADKYTGFTSFSTIMGDIFDKLDLDLELVHTSSDITATSNRNLFNNLNYNNNNFYDNNDKPMSCREVLDSILEPLGLIMSFKGDTIYIIDPINLHTVAKGYTYDTAPFGANETQVNLGGYLDISTGGIKWYETGGILDIVQPYNKVNIKYDPYNYLGGNYDFNDTDNVAGGAWSDYTEYDYWRYWNVGGATLKDWVISVVDPPIGVEGLRNTVDDDGVFFFRQIGAFAGTYTYTFPMSNIKQDDNIMLRVDMDVYINTKNSDNIYSNTDPGTTLYEAWLGNIQVKIGAYYAHTYITQHWDSAAGDILLYVKSWDNQDPYIRIRQGISYYRYIDYESGNITPINDRWVKASIFLPLTDASIVPAGLLNGDIQVIIKKALNVAATEPAGHSADVDWVYINNVGVSIVDLNKIEITNEGIATEAEITGASAMRPSPLDIDLKSGIGTYGASRGAISSNIASPAGTNLTGLARTGNATLRTASQLLSQTLLGQYGSPRFKLTGKLNVIAHLLNTTLYLIKDTNYLGAKAFYIVSGTYNDREESMEVTMVEITDTRQTI